jgi:hypothetical protein
VLMKHRGTGVLALARRCVGLGAHLRMYDFAGLEPLLQRGGFVNVRRCTLGDAEDPMFALVEDRDRFFAGSDPELAVEAIKVA